MSEQTIICPNCGTNIPVSKVLTEQIEADFRKTYETKAKEREIELQTQYDKKFSEEINLAIKQQQRDLDSRLEEEKSKLEKQIQKDIEINFAEEIANLKKELRDKEKEAQELKKKQDDIEKRQKLVEAREKSINSEIEKKVSLALKKAEIETEKRIASEHHNRELILEKKLSDAKRKATELKLKLDQSSQQAQGEVIELDVEKTLKKVFPEDKIARIAKGKLGADILQKVYSSGKYCGMIIWESKNTKTWSKNWLSKLRNDQRRSKAELAVLVSRALPKNVSNFAQVDGVWVSDFSLIQGVATALRNNLAEIALLKLSTKGKNEKKELLYEYVTSTEFKLRVEGIVEAFRTMQDDLNKERQLMEKHWAKRGIHLQIVLENVSGMYGDMQGIAGKFLPKIKRLELPAPIKREKQKRSTR